MTYGRHNRSNGIKLNPEHMDADGVRERIKNQHRKNIRSSDTRRQFLQKYARIISGIIEARLEFGQLACVTMDSGDPVINIPAREFDQPVTDYEQDVFDMMMQETLTVHEILHILYTNFRSFKRYLNKCEMDKQPLFKEIWNGFEDGAIEEQGRLAMSIGDELEVMNANFTEDIVFGTEQSNGDMVYTMHEAVVAGIMDKSVFDSGALSKIRDPNENHRLSTPQDQQTFENFVPKIESTAKSVLTEPSSKNRNAIIYDFYEDYLDLLDEAQIDGAEQRRKQHQEESGQGQGHAHPNPNMPDDSEGHTGGERQDAYMLGDDDQMEDIDERMSGAGNPSEPEDEEEEQEGSGGGGEQEQEEDEDEQGHGQDVETKDDLEQEYEEELESEWQQMAQSNDDIRQEMEEAVRMLEAIEDGTNSSNSDWDPSSVELEIPEPSDDFHQDRRNEAKRQAKQLENILRSRLRNERKSKTQTHRRRGKFDRRRMMAASRGNTRVFSQEIEPDEKEYDCVIVYDRSGSMSGDDRDLEIAGGMLAYALHAVNVNVSTIGLYGSEARLELPFGVDPDFRKETLFAGDISGGTPLSKAVFLSRHRLAQNYSMPFMIVITDGQPDNFNRYKEELMKCNFPIIGVYLNTSRSAEDVKDCFHRVSNVSGDNLTLELKQLVQQIMF